MSTHDVLAALDEQQRDVALTLDRPVVVLAGAGSGKTRAITHRIAYAVQTGRYVPTATLAVTFTTRAAGEMKARLARLGADGVQARTIHSAALRQAQYFWPKAYGSELPPVASSIISLVARAAGGVVGQTTTPLLRDLAGEIGWAKSANVDPADYPELAERDGRSVSGVAADQVSRIMANYERIKTGEGVIDFDDILLCTAAMLAEHDDIAAQVRAAYRHFVVDEYQDISAIQHRLLNLWVGGRRDFCVVGDPSQAIHSFAGARPQYLLRFRRDWPGSVQLELSTNYRSSPQILAMANEVIGSSGGIRLRPTRPSGPMPEIHRYPSDPEEAAGVASWLTAQHAAGVPWRELAVLYRINAQAPALESALAEAGVPYQVRGVERFYDRPEIRQALALIRQAAATDPA
ncbi:MAG: ATP-dependent helicase, partial [Propionibacteriaceae bacterium]|nr:ATP-dependent helicase [Propionibacteriaceae bacterium]